MAKNEMVESEKLQDDIKFKKRDIMLQKSPNDYSEYDYEYRRIQAIHQVLSRKFSYSPVLDDSDKSEEKDNEKETKRLMFSDQNAFAKQHTYHDLSTIQEVDSGLTSSNLQLSQSKLSDTSETKRGKDILPKEKLNVSFQSAENLKMASLLDPPDTEIAELAKSIHFVPETEKNINHTLKSFKSGFACSPVEKYSSSKEYLSTPTLTTGSYSSVSVSTPSLPLSSSSQSIPSAKSRENKDNQDCIKSGFICDLELQDVTDSDCDKQDMNTKLSGHINDLNVPLMSADEHLDEDNKSSILSGYIRDLDVQHKANSDLSHFAHERENVHPITPRYISEVENFKPMIPHSNVSKITEFVDHALVKDSKDDSTRDFKPMTPHFNVSSPSESLNLVLKSDRKDNNSAKSFKALTPHFNVSSPSSDIFSIDKYKGFVSSSESFKPLTPYSNVSSPTSDVFIPFENVPTDDTSSSEKLKDKVCFKNTKNKPIILRFDISTDFVTVNAIENEPFKAKHVSQLNCNLSFKTLLKQADYNQTTQVPESEIISEVINNKKYGDESKNKVQVKRNGLDLNANKRYALSCSSDVFVPSKNKIQKRHKGLPLSLAKSYALASSSDFFIPSTNRDFTPINENMSKGLCEISIANNDEILKPDAVIGSQMSISDVKINEVNLQKESDKTESDSESAILDKKISKKTAEEKLITMKLKETPQAQVQLEDIKKQYSNLKSLSSASSSSESLSVISRSKVVHQSTPIKNISELLQQEPGILGEPTLTLIDLDTTEIPKGPLTSISSDIPLHPEKNCRAGFSKNKCRTSISRSQQFLDSPETPSMISFLQHEITSLQAESNNVLVQSPTYSNPVQPNLEENTTPALKEVKRSLFQRTGYKERTKRLWNNLEEVKKKNTAEERKREMENNRKKAKEFAKVANKLTPKRRKS